MLGSTTTIHYQYKLSKVSFLSLKMYGAVKSNSYFLKKIIHKYFLSYKLIRFTFNHKPFLFVRWEISLLSDNV